MVRDVISEIIYHSLPANFKSILLSYSRLDIFNLILYCQGWSWKGKTQMTEKSHENQEKKRMKEKD